MRWLNRSASALALALAVSCTSAPAFGQGAPLIASPPQAPAAAVVAAPAPAAPSGLDGWQVGQGARGESLLPAGLWRGSDAVAVGALLDKLSGPYASPAATRLARAALLTGGGAPQGSEAAVNEALRKRYAALGRFGAADEISAMANVSPAALLDANILGFAAQADLARGRIGDACRRVRGAPNASAAFILRVRAFCFAENGEEAAADLAAEVARNAGVNDQWLFATLPAVAGAPTTAPAHFDTSLNAAASLVGNLRPGAKPLANASPLALGVVARFADTPALLRAEAAQAGLRLYAIEPRLAREALAGAGALKGAPLLAASLPAIGAAPNASAKAAAIAALFKNSPTYGDFVAAARVLDQEVRALPRDASTANQALAMARACLADGDGEGAARWRDVIALASQSPGERNRAALDVALVAAGQGGEEMARVTIERRLELGGAGAARDAAIFKALGLPTPARAAEVIAAAPEPKTAKPADPALVRALLDAARRGAQGEAALLASLTLAPGAHMIDRQSLLRVIEALRAVGLPERAREAAVEAMIGPGIG